MENAFFFRDRDHPVTVPVFLNAIPLRPYVFYSILLPFYSVPESSLTTKTISQPKNYENSLFCV